MFIAALVTTAMAWKQLKCLLKDDWIKKMWCIHTLAYYSVIRKDEIPSFVKTWIYLENTMLSKIGQAEKVKNHVISLVCGI